MEVIKLSQAEANEEVAENSGFAQLFNVHPGEKHLSDISILPECEYMY